MTDWLLPARVLRVGKPIDFYSYEGHTLIVLFMGCALKLNQYKNHTILQEYKLQDQPTNE